jgi:hypothetical protein
VKDRPRQKEEGRRRKQEGRGSKRQNETAETMNTGTSNKTHLIELVEDFTLAEENNGLGRPAGSC